MICVCKASNSICNALLPRCRYSQENLVSVRTLSWSQSLGQDPRRPVSAPHYGRYCYSIQTLPAQRRRMDPFSSRMDIQKMAYVLPGTQGPSLSVGPLESGSVFLGKNLNGSEQMDKRADGSTESIPKQSEAGSEVISESQDQQGAIPFQEVNWNLSLILISVHSVHSDQILYMKGSSQSGSCSEASSSSVGQKRELSSHCLATRASISTITTDDSTADKNGDQSPKTVPFRTMEGTLLRNGRGISLPGSGLLYPEAPGMMGLYGVGGRSFVMPLPGGTGMFENGWRLGNGKVGQLNLGKEGTDLLTNRMGDFLQHRLAVVSFDPMQPPYDSLQTYGLEGSGSQATSLSSLDSEADKDTAGQKAPLEELGPKFDKLLEIFRKRANETEKGKEGCIESKAEDERDERTNELNAAHKEEKDCRKEMEHIQNEH
ncbi:hypothetical protein DNTS_009190 [Danionella cerebrum]|uniref:Cadherin Y-type LIR-motif domain-containing protein n=1 Tax=Danionella cerebrum TaxID=2873325 RepID=A0A553MMS3_9TELE|nr:hypothetical protein DNTS_009190 [Danionella translucida]